MQKQDGAVPEMLKFVHLEIGKSDTAIQSMSISGKDTTDILQINNNAVVVFATGCVI